MQHKFCLCLFDWPNTTDEHVILRALIEATTSTHLRNQYCMVQAMGDEKPSRRFFGQFLEQFQAEGARDAFETVELYFSESGTAADPTGDWQGALVLTHGAGIKKMAFFALPESAWSTDAWRSLVVSLAGAGPLGYGACFRWIDASSPLFYAAGMTHVPRGGSLTDRALRSFDLSDSRIDIAAWRDERSPGGDEPARMRHRVGFFRDVYEMNILSQAHLDRQVVDGMSLAEAIASKARWGALDALPNGNWLWTPEPEAISEIRSVFTTQKLLIRTLSE